MSDGLKLPITAEGIENETILEALKRLGKMKGQGYHYGRPEPADKVRERLADHGLLAGPSEQVVDLAEQRAKRSGKPSADQRAG